jgi:hypothetical protein
MRRSVSHEEKRIEAGDGMGGRRREAAAAAAAAASQIALTALVAVCFERRFRSLL